MRSIESGTTTERIVRAAFLTVLLSLFAVAFLWDGYLGDPAETARQLARSLGTAEKPAPRIIPKLTESEGRRLAATTLAGEGMDGLTAILGEPGLRHGDDVYFLGPGGHLRVRGEDGRISEIVWVAGVRDDSDLRFQRWLGYALGVVSLVLTFRLFRIVGTRASLTEAGLRLPGKPVIPLDAITAVRKDPSDRGERVTLEYNCEGRDNHVLVDGYVIKELSSIVRAICEHNRLPNPFDGNTAGPEESRVHEPEHRQS